MGKRKLTLSVDEDLVDEVKLFASRVGRSLSSLVEEYFEYLVLAKWVDCLAKELGLEVLEPTSETEVLKSRPAGLEASRVVREIREGRVKAVFHGEK